MLRAAAVSGICMERYTTWSPVFLVLVKFIIFIFVSTSQDAPLLAADNAQGGDLAGHNGAHTDYGAIAYCCPGRDADVHSNPDVSTNDHRFKLKSLVIWKTVSSVTVVGCV